MALLSKEEMTQVEAAIAQAEAASAGEIVVGVVRQSGEYGGPRAACTAMWTVAVALLARHFLPQLACGWILLAELPVAVLSYLLLGVPAVTRWLIGAGRADAQVRARALQMFAERGVHRTRDHSGLLIMISELEHRVTILADGGIHAHMGAAAWDAQVRRIVVAIKAGRLAPALVEVIQECGRMLASKFPRRPDDTNELPDHVVTE